ncbi:MAG: DUF362 domain-containing protein [Desulfovibrionaceae bacterium]
MAFPVALARCAAYEPALLHDAVARLFAAIAFAPAPGARVLVKPNLLRAANGGLPCTHPLVVAAVCRWLLDHGAAVRVADSPGFGTARGVGGKIGLAAALAPLGVPLVNLHRTEPLRLSFGHTIGVAPEALEADWICNLPKLKAHSQFRVTGAVKNWFGCVPGARKAVAHSRYGEQGNRFESLIIEIMQAMPPSVALLDGVTAMHVAGPVMGEPYPLGLLAASWSSVALDTAVYGMLGLAPEALPLWRELLRRGVAGADAATVAYPLERPEVFDVSGFQLPHALNPVSFHPRQLVRSLLRRTWARLRKWG